MRMFTRHPALGFTTGVLLGLGLALILTTAPPIVRRSMHAPGQSLATSIPPGALVIAPAGTARALRASLSDPSIDVHAAPRSMNPRQARLEDLINRWLAARPVYLVDLSRTTIERLSTRFRLRMLEGSARRVYHVEAPLDIVP